MPFVTGSASLVITMYFVDIGIVGTRTFLVAEAFVIAMSANTPDIFVVLIIAASNALVLYFVLIAEECIVNVASVADIPFGVRAELELTERTFVTGTAETLISDVVCSVLGVFVVATVTAIDLKEASHCSFKSCFGFALFIKR